ncbi:MAG: hypothetical protein WKG00_33845 [Polyangiaceae bacterium]
MSLRIDDIVRHGRAFKLGVEMPLDDIRPTIRALFEMLGEAKVDYLLVGGVALLSYVAGRNTEDIDLIVRPEEATRLPWQATVADVDFGRASFGGVRVDLLLTSNDLFRHVLEAERTVVRFGELDVPCATREGLLLLKLFALPSLYRQNNLARAALYETDILMLHQDADVDDARLLERIRPFVSRSDLQELEKILDEQRSRRRFGK